MKKNLWKNICRFMLLALVFGLFLTNGPAVRADDEGQASIEVINGTRKDDDTEEVVSNSETYTFGETERLCLGFMEPLEGYFKPKVMMDGREVATESWQNKWNVTAAVNDGYPNGWVRITGYNLTPNDGASFTVTFQPIDYTIKFDANGGTGEMDDLPTKYDANTKLPKCSFKNSGYTFKEWTTEPDGSGESFKNKATVSKLTTERDGSITLYAQWKKKSSSDDQDVTPTPAPEPTPEETTPVQGTPFAVPNTATGHPAFAFRRVIMLGVCPSGIRR